MTHIKRDVARFFAGRLNCLCGVIVQWVRTSQLVWLSNESVQREERFFRGEENVSRSGPSCSMQQVKRKKEIQHSYMFAKVANKFGPQASAVAHQNSNSRLIVVRGRSMATGARNGTNKINKAKHEIHELAAMNDHVATTCQHKQS